MSQQELQGKVAIVTGASSGIGEATSVALARAGARVVLGARREAELERVAGRIRDAGGEVRTAVTDVTSHADVQALVALAEQAFGGVDTVFVNAGVEGTLNPIVEDSDDNYDLILDVNVRGAWNTLRAAVPALRRRGGGSVVTTSSVAGRKGFPSFSLYVASKHALEGLTKSAAVELAPESIRVNAVAPGPIDTAMLDRATGGDQTVFSQLVPQQRSGTVDEVAHAVVFLASDRASYITGQSLAIDGGMTA